MPYTSIINDPTTVPNPTQGTRYHSIVPDLPNPQFVASRLNEQTQLKQQQQQPQSKSFFSKLGGDIKNIVAPDHNRLAGIENFVKSAAVGTEKAAATTGAGVINLVNIPLSKIPGYNAGTKNRPINKYVPVQNEVGTPKVLSSKNIGEPNLRQYLASGVETGALGLGGASIAENALAGGIMGAASSETGKKAATPKQFVEDTIAGVGAGAGGTAVAKGVGKVLAKSKEAPPVEAPASIAENTPKITPANSAPVKAPKTAPNEAGFAAPGTVIKDAQDLINKHQTSVKFSGDVRRFADSTEGAKNNLLNDAAGLVKNRTQLTNEEKTQLQAYRDAKATNQELPQVSDKVLQADKEATAFAKAKIANDVERAKLDGNLQKAKTIAQQNPETYTHRVAQNKGGSFDYALQGDRKNPLSVGLGKSTPADKTRTMFAAVDENGNRRVISVKTQTGKNAIGQKFTKPNQVVAWEGGKATQPLGSLPRKADIIGKKFEGKDGHTYTIDHATASEVEKNTGVKYYKDPYLTNQAAYLDSRIALENARMFDAIKKSPEAEKIMSAPGETAPKGWKSVPGLMQFQGYKFEPRVAESLHDAFVSGTSEADALDRVGKALRQTIVYFPVKHDANMAAAYVVDRGASSLVNPMAYKRMVSSWKIAADALRTKNELYQNIAKQGFGLTTNDKAGFEKMFKNELSKLTPNKITPIAKAAKLNPIALYKSIQKLSVWEVQDFLNIARIAERMQPKLVGKGMSLEDALKQTEKYSFQYKVPERVVGSRSASKALQSNKVFFGRYRYDQYKILGNILKGIVDVRNPRGVAQNIDKAAALAAGSLLVWPAVNKGIQAVTGNPNAYNKAPGPMELPELVAKVAKGNEAAGTAAGNQLYLGPIQQGLDLKANRDSFTGKQIYDPNTSAKQQGKDIMNWIINKLAPIQRTAGLKNTTGNRVTSIALMLSGTNFPKNSPETNKLNSLKYDTLPNVQSSAKTLVQQGNTQAAVETIKAYDQQVLDSAKKAFEQAGKPIPDDSTLKSDLTKAGYYYNPAVNTVQSWSRTTNVQGTLDKILNPTSSSGRRRSGGRTSSQKILP